MSYPTILPMSTKTSLGAGAPQQEINGIIKKNLLIKEKKTTKIMELHLEMKVNKSF